jgi:hypothetical protein
MILFVQDMVNVYEQIPVHALMVIVGQIAKIHLALIFQVQTRLYALEMVTVQIRILVIALQNSLAYSVK